jgi:hypothetical protein
MPTQIQFKMGEYYRFNATRDFKLAGGALSQGDELLFDGTNAVFNGGNPVPMPNLRGAVKAGWVVLAEDYDSEDMTASMPKSAGVRVRNAQGGNPNDRTAHTLVTTTDSEEQEVGSISAHAQQTRNINASQFRGGRRGNNVAQVEEQDGTVVGSVSTPAKQEANLEHESAGEILKRAANTQIKPGRGKTRDQMLAEMPEEARIEYLAQIEAKKAGLPGSDRDASGNSIVGSVSAPKTVESGGFTIKNAVARGSTPIVDMSGETGKSEVSTIEVDGIKITNTNGPKVKPAKKPIPVGQDPRRTIALSICADFPDNYRFEDPIRKKIARLQADYDNRPDVIRAVAAAETDAEVKARLITEFPEAFGG